MVLLLLLLLVAEEGDLDFLLLLFSFLLSLFWLFGVEGVGAVVELSIVVVVVLVEGVFSIADEGEGMSSLGRGKSEGHM